MGRLLFLIFTKVNYRAAARPLPRSGPGLHPLGCPAASDPVRGAI